MDPNANLAEQREIIARMLAEGSEYVDTGDALRLAELAQALDEWITKGGFLPKAWALKFAVKKTGRTWSVFQGEKLIEGGFFERDVAEECAVRLALETDK